MPDATVVVSTKNRRDDLARLLPTVLAQTADCEVLVIDDGSTDDTAEMVRADFPSVRLERSEQSLGYIRQRNRGAELARAPLIVSVDDDAVFPSAATVEQTIADFDHPRIGAVAIPFTDARPTGDVELQRAPDPEGRWLTSSYIGTAHAVRRDVFLEVGGYRASLLHQVEEPDFCLRMLGAGFVTRIGRADPLLHLESPKRDFSKLLTLTARNELLKGWHNVPMPYLPVRWAKVLATCALLAVRWRAPGALVRGTWQGLRDAYRLRGDRRPVSRRVYLVDHDIRKRGPLRVEDVEDRLDGADRLVAANIRGYRRTVRRYERLHGEIFNEREQARLHEALGRMLAEIAPNADDRPPHVLDFGCGSGNVTRHLLEHGATVLAADVSPEFLALVRDQFAGRPVETFELNGRDLAGLADASVDAAVSYSVLHHIPDYLHAVGELCRVVRPGGTVLIDHEAAPREWEQDGALAEFRARVVERQRAEPKRLRRFVDPWHYRTLGRHHLTQLRRRLGDPRYWPEGDIHIWPDDHIEWDQVERVLRERGFEPIASEDYLLYREGTPEVLFERYRHLTADVRMLLARRAAD